MLSSIARACSDSATLEALRASSLVGTSKSPDLRSLLDMVSALALSHFGSVSSERSAYSVLPDSLFDLERNHPSRLAAKQPASLFPHHKLAPKDDPVKEDGVRELLSNMLTVYECPKSSFVMQVFMLPRGCVMPLHDHPGMTVISKILRGTIDMTSYSFLHSIDSSANSSKVPKSSLLRKSQELMHGREVVPISRQLLSDDTGKNSVAIVYPERGNLHAIRALDHSLFLDILAPPYIPPVDCTYYKLKRMSSDLGRSIGTEAELDSVHSMYPAEEEIVTNRFFVKPFHPVHFSCSEAHWQGPKITL